MQDYIIKHSPEIIKPLGFGSHFLSLSRKKCFNGNIYCETKLKTWGRHPVTEHKMSTEPHTAANSDSRPKIVFNANHWTLNGGNVTLPVFKKNDTKTRYYIWTQTSASFTLLKKKSTCVLQMKGVNHAISCTQLLKIINRSWGFIPKQQYIALPLRHRARSSVDHFNESGIS